MRASIRSILVLTAVGVLLGALFTRPLPAAAADQAAAEGVRPPEPAVVIVGNARERGRAYGEHFRQGIRDFLETEIYEAYIGKVGSKDEMRQYAADCGKVVRDVCPVIAEEYDGIAEGAGLRLDEILLIHLHEEFYHRGKLPKLGHCTVVAAAPPDTGNDHTYLGQTWDWLTTVAGKSSIVEWRRDEGASVLAYGYPGMPMGAGMNSEGIALCWTSAALGIKGQQPRVGLPSYVLIAHLLNQTDIDSVIREAQRDKHAGWFTFVLADGSGRIVNIEGSPQGVVVEEADGRMVRAGFGTREMTGVEPGQPVPMIPRCVTLSNLLQKSKGKNGRRTLQRYLENPKYEVSTANRPRNVTLDVMMFDTTAKTAYLTRGPEYGIDWREFRFGDPE